LARKNFISSLLLWKRLQGSIPSFLPSLETLTRFRSFLPFQWCGIERRREDVHKVCGCERKRECICYFSIIEGFFF
jgi:hypothetical protein